jgi:hypothetical protein
MNCCPGEALETPPRAKAMEDDAITSPTIAAHDNILFIGSLSV